MSEPIQVSLPDEFYETLESFNKEKDSNVIEGESEIYKKNIVAEEDVQTITPTYNTKFKSDYISLGRDLFSGGSDVFFKKYLEFLKRQDYKKGAKRDNYIVDFNKYLQKLANSLNSLNDLNKKNINDKNVLSNLLASGIAGLVTAKNFFTSFFNKPKPIANKGLPNGNKVIGKPKPTANKGLPNGNKVTSNKKYWWQKYKSNSTPKTTVKPSKFTIKGLSTKNIVMSVKEALKGLGASFGVELAIANRKDITKFLGIDKNEIVKKVDSHFNTEEKIREHYRKAALKKGFGNWFISLTEPGNARMLATASLGKNPLLNTAAAIETAFINGVDRSMTSFEIESNKRQKEYETSYNSVQQQIDIAKRLIHYFNIPEFGDLKSIKERQDYIKQHMYNELQTIINSNNLDEETIKKISERYHQKFIRLSKIIDTEKDPTQITRILANLKQLNNPTPYKNVVELPFGLGEVDYELTNLKNLFTNGKYDNITYKKEHNFDTLISDYEKAKDIYEARLLTNDILPVNGVNRENKTNFNINVDHENKNFSLLNDIKILLNNINKNISNVNSPTIINNTNITSNGKKTSSNYSVDHRRNYTN